MRKTIIYIALSIDGYIADEKGGVDWLEAIPNPDKSDYGYQQFYDDVDTVIMGNTTYKQILGFDVPFPYAGKAAYVLSQSQTGQDEHVSYINNDIPGFVKKIKNKPGKAIWIVGGSQVNALLLQENLVDELMLFYMPVILGKGIPFVTNLGLLPQFALTGVQQYQSGVVMHQYARLTNESG